VKVIAGREHNACIDFTAINAGAILYLAGKATDMQAGVQLSLKSIADGSALAKLISWIAAQNTDPTHGLDIFEKVMVEAGIS
jgi:anthranilate phosphoribosyltransferase